MISCSPLRGDTTGYKFATTTDLGAVVGLSVRATLPKGAVTGAVVPTTPVTRTTAAPPTGTQASEDEGNAFKPVPTGAAIAAGLAVLALLIQAWRSSAINPAKRAALVALIIATGFLAADAALLVSGLDLMAWALMPVYFILSVLFIGTGLLVAVIYSLQANTLNKMFRGENLLVHWTFAAEEWLVRSQEEFERRRVLSATYMRYAAVVAVLIIAVTFLMAASEDDPTVLRMIGVGVAVVFFVAVVIGNLLSLRFADPRRARSQDVWISLDGVYAFGELTTWRRNVSLLSEIAQVELVGGTVLGNMLEGIELKEGPNPVLEFRYAFWVRAIKQWSTVVVPVPLGQEQAARNVRCGLQASRDAGSAGDGRASDLIEEKPGEMNRTSGPNRPSRGDSR